MLPSNKFSLKGRDWLKGLLMTIGTSFITTITQSFISGAMPNAGSLKVAGLAGAGAGLMYISKNFLTNDVKIAEKVIQEAQQKKIENSLINQNK